MASVYQGLSLINLDIFLSYLYQMRDQGLQEQIESMRLYESQRPQNIANGATQRKKQKVNSSTPHSSIEYRADIDGLRTISIIFVVLHHAWNQTFLGGYMGVCIFFVISGYLISKSIFRELRQQKSFSYSKFYSRRIRRIFPALIVMLIYSFILFFQCYSPEQLKKASQQMMSAILMVINIHMMYKEYTNDHSWSYVQVLWTLGVGEQFYLFWPFFATKLWKLPMEKGLIAIGFATFILYELQVDFDPNQNRYGLELFLFPFWQLLLGCFVAYYQQKKLQREQNSLQTLLTPNGHIQEPLVRVKTLWEKTKSTKGILSSVAAILILLSLSQQNYIERWVYWYPIAAFSTAVFIHCGTGIFNDLLLGNRITIFIGKISYSWYLLHFPLVKGCRFFIDNLFVKILTSFILAIICTYGIENNIRWNKSKYVIPGLILAMGLLLILSFIVYLFPEAWASIF